MNRLTLHTIANEYKKIAMRSVYSLVTDTVFTSYIKAPCNKFAFGRTILSVDSIIYYRIIYLIYCHKLCYNKMLKKLNKS